MFVSGPFYDIWTPKVLEIDKAEGPRAPVILGEILVYYNLILIAAGLGLALFSRDVIELATGPDFHAAAAQVPLLALAMVFFGYRGLTMPGALIRERSGLIARGTAIAGVAALGLNMLLIPRWGVTGASLATLLSFVVEFLLMRALVIRIYPLPIPLVQTLLPVAIAAVVWGLAELVAPAGTWWPLSVGLRAAAYLAFGGLLLLPGVLAPAQGALRVVRQG
jgi:O-antigen/teichoic acid export membrane protein